MRCPNPERHEPHWHTIRADNITVASGECYGEPLARIEEAHATALEGSWRTADVETAALGDLLAVVKAARDVLEAKAGVDARDPETVAPLTAADERLNAALANLEGGAS